MEMQQLLANQEKVEANRKADQVKADDSLEEMIARLKATQEKTDASQERMNIQLRNKIHSKCH